MRNNLRTDLAAELVKATVSSSDDICTVSVLRLDAEQAKRYRKAPGKYTTIETRAVSDGIQSAYGRLSGAVARTLTSYCARPETVLVAGLGNEGMTADALGALTADGVNVSGSRLRTVKAGVMGATGVESFDVIKGVTDRIQPSLVIVVDSLAAASVERVCNVVQFSDGGITPGSGVSNHRKTLSKETLGVPVISVGVPLVVYASTIINEMCGGRCENNESDYVRSLIVTPKDIDILVRDCAKIISDGINAAYGT